MAMRLLALLLLLAAPLAAQAVPVSVLDVPTCAGSLQYSGSGQTLTCGAAGIGSGTSLPGSCSEGQIYQDTDSGGNEVYVCSATDTWSKLGGYASGAIPSNGDLIGMSGGFANPATPFSF